MTNDSKPKEGLWQACVSGLATLASHTCPEVAGLDPLKQQVEKNIPAESAVERLAQQDKPKRER